MSDTLGYYFTEYWVKVYSDNLDYAQWDGQLVNRHGTISGILFIPKEMEHQFERIDKPRLDQQFS